MAGGEGEASSGNVGAVEDSAENVLVAMLAKAVGGAGEAEGRGGKGRGAAGVSKAQYGCIAIHACGLATDRCLDIGVALGGSCSLPKP